MTPEDGIALRGLFIIDKEGVVQHATINNLAFGRSVDETLRTLQVRGPGCTTWGSLARG